MRYSISLPATLVCCSLAVLAACSPDKGPGSLTIDYVLGNSKTCAEVGVERVRATIYENSIDDEDAVEQDVACSSEAVIEFSDVEPGVYKLLVTGYDAGDVAIFDNLGQPETERRREVFEAAEASVEAELTARPAELAVAWRLGEGGFANCDGVGIDTFDITAYQVGGGTILLETVLDCTQTSDTGFRPVEDPDRNLNGVLFGEVGIQARDSSGAAIGDSLVFVFEPVGPGYPVNLAIECTADGCYEQP